MLFRSIVTGFGISNETVSSLSELHIAMQRIHPGLHVIVAKMPDRERNADLQLKIYSTYQDNSEIIESVP